MHTSRDVGSTGVVCYTGKTRWVKKTDLPEMQKSLCRKPGGEPPGSQNKNLRDLPAERITPIILPEVAKGLFVLAGFPVAQQRRHHREGNDCQGCGDLGTGKYVG